MSEFKYVPVVATERMTKIAEGVANVTQHTAGLIWEYMIVAAPTQPSPAESDMEAAQPSDDGMCKSCVGDMCVTGSECVTLGLDYQPIDKEMLDWMLKNNGLVELRGGQYYCGYGPYGTVLNGALADSPREAIKAAMLAQDEK